MAVSIAILNRQRRISVELPVLQETNTRLSQCLFDNLRNRGIERLTKRDLDDMQKRGALSLVLVSNTKIRALNKKWRGKDYATDVLSFPLAADETGIFQRAQPGEETWEIGELVI